MTFPLFCSTKLFQVRNPEVVQSPEDQSAQKWIRYEYGGNCHSNIQLNPKIVDRLIMLLGSPCKPLIIKEGDLRREDFEVVIGIRGGELTGFPLPERRSTSEFFEEDENCILLVHSQVIDGRIQGKNNFNQESYRETFVRELINAITWGIEEWTSKEIDRDGSFLKRMKKSFAIDRFWAKNKDKIVTPVFESPPK